MNGQTKPRADFAARRELCLNTYNSRTAGTAIRLSFVAKGSETKAAEGAERTRV